MTDKHPNPEIELLPCPFCGGNAERDTWDKNRDYAGCRSCDYWIDIGVWNKRIPPSDIERAAQVCDGLSIPQMKSEYFSGVEEGIRRCATAIRALPASAGAGGVALNVRHKDCHKAANAFWQYWRENGVPHKHGYYESTWGAINQALRCVGVVTHEYKTPPIDVNGTSYLNDCIAATPNAAPAALPEVKCEHGKGMYDYCQPCGRIHGA